jgi:hypothetical protein
VISDSSAFLFPLLLALCVLAGVFITVEGFCNAEAGYLVSEDEGRKGDVSGVGEVIDKEGGIWSNAGDDDDLRSEVDARGDVDGSMVFSLKDIVRSLRFDSFAGILLPSSSSTPPELVLVKRLW